MKRILLVTPCVSARLAQAQPMFRGLDCAIDTLMVGQDLAGSDIKTLRSHEEGALAVAPVPPSHLSSAENTDPLEAMLSNMAPREGYAGIFLAGCELPVGVLPDVPRIFDAADGAVASWPVRPPALFLAADERIRQDGAWGAEHSARWPLELPQVINAPGGGGLVGWPDMLNGSEAESWSRIAERMVQTRVAIPGGLLLDTSVKLPALLA